MRAASWVAGLAVFLILFGVYSFRLGVDPTLMHDDYEYTYPSFSLVERGDFGSPLLGSGFNVAHRTYHFTIYYFASVHSLLIRLFGDRPESIPLANTFHFALLAAAGTLFLARRGAWLGAAVFVCSLVADSRMVDAARQGRPEMTAGCCLTLAVVALWIWLGEGRGVLPAVGVGLSLTAGIFSHTSVAFFAGALILAWSVQVVRQRRPKEIVAAVAPCAAIPLLYAYFVLTDCATNVRQQMTPVAGNVVAGRLAGLLSRGDWTALAVLLIGFLREHLSNPTLWAGLGACLVLPWVTPGPEGRAARYFGLAYLICVAVHFVFLKHFVLTYRCIYQPVLYLGLAFVAEVASERAARIWKTRRGAVVLRSSVAVLVIGLAVISMAQFRSRLFERQPQFAGLQGALAYALLESGARPGDRVLVPSPLAFHLRRRFDVIAYPAIARFFQGEWGSGFRDGLRQVWGPGTVAEVDEQSLCFATGLAFLHPRWVVEWNLDYGVVKPFRDFLRRFPRIPGIELTASRRAPLPWPYGGVVRVYRVDYSEAITGLDRTAGSAPLPCP